VTAAETETRSPEINTGSPTDQEHDEATDGSMTLVEHLEELRKRLIIALIAIAVGSIVGYVFWEQILRFLLTPLPDISSHLVGSNGTKLIQTQIGEAFVISETFRSGRVHPRFTGNPLSGVGLYLTCAHSS